MIYIINSSFIYLFIYLFTYFIYLFIYLLIKRGRANSHQVPRSLEFDSSQILPSLALICSEEGAMFCDQLLHLIDKVYNTSPCVTKSSFQAAYLRRGASTTTANLMNPMQYAGYSLAGVTMILFCVGWALDTYRKNRQKQTVVKGDDLRASAL